MNNSTCDEIHGLNLQNTVPVFGKKLHVVFLLEGCSVSSIKLRLKHQKRVKCRLQQSVHFYVLYKSKVRLRSSKKGLENKAAMSFTLNLCSVFDFHSFDSEETQFLFAGLSSSSSFVLNEINYMS